MTSRSGHMAITGASSGIGEGLARHFAAKGWRITLVARRKALMDAIAGELPTDSVVAATDLADLESCGDWIAEAERRLGPVDVFVNNAGAQFVEPALEVDDARAQWLFRLNVLAPMKLGRRFGLAMAERGAGALVNIASVAALQPTPHMAHYGGTKAALASWSEVLRTELVSRGVHVLTVYPGPVKTPLEAAARERVATSPLVGAMPVGTTAGLARAVESSLRRRAARLVYPGFYRTTRWFPAFSQWVSEQAAPPLRKR